MTEVSTTTWEIIHEDNNSTTGNNFPTQQEQNHDVKVELKSITTKYVCFACFSQITYSDVEDPCSTRVQNDDCNSVIQLLCKALKFPSGFLLKTWVSERLKNFQLDCCHSCYTKLSEVEQLRAQLDVIEQRLEVIKNELKVSILSNYQKDQQLPKEKQDEQTQQQKDVSTETQTNEEQLVDSLHSLRSLFVQCWSDCKVELPKLTVSEASLSNKKLESNSKSNNNSPSSQSLASSKRIRKKSTKILEAERDAKTNKSSSNKVVNKSNNDMPTDDEPCISQVCVDSDYSDDVKEENNDENKEKFIPKVKKKAKPKTSSSPTSSIKRNQIKNKTKVPKGVAPTTTTTTPNTNTTTSTESIKNESVNTAESIPINDTVVIKEKRKKLEPKKVKPPKTVFSSTSTRGIQSYSCTLCDKKFQTRAAMKTHIANIHDKTYKYLCELCSQGFQVLSMLKRHKQYVHTSEKAFECEVCHMKFKRSHQLFYHKRRHTGELPFICHLCGKGYIQAERLRMHLEIHSGEKKYACPIAGCNKYFAIKQYVTNHIHDTHEKRRRNRNPKRQTPTTNTVEIILKEENQNMEQLKSSNLIKNPKLTETSMDKISHEQPVATYHLESLTPVPLNSVDNSHVTTVKVTTHAENEPILIEELQVGEVIVPLPNGEYGEEIVVFRIP